MPENRIWPYCTIGERVEINVDVNVGTCTEIGDDSWIGEGTRIGHGVFLPKRSLIYPSVFIGPNVTFTDDRYPRANNYGYKPEAPVVKTGASIGAGSTILPGITIGRDAVVGAGSVVTKDVPDSATVVGNPAQEI